MAAFPALRPRRRLLRLPQTCVGCSRCSRSYGPYRPSPGHTLALCPHSRIKCDRFPPFPATKSSGQQEEATNKAGRLPEVSAAARRPASVSLPAAVNQITDLTGYRPPATGHRLQATGHRPPQARPCRPCLAYLVTFPTTHLLRREVTRDLLQLATKSLAPSFNSSFDCDGLSAGPYRIGNQLTPSTLRTFAGQCSLSFTRSLSAFDPLRSHVVKHSPPSFAPLPRGRSMGNNHPN